MRHLHYFLILAVGDDTIFNRLINQLFKKIFLKSRYI
jgi:hypothetical protein